MLTNDELEYAMHQQAEQQMHHHFAPQAYGVPPQALHHHHHHAPHHQHQLEASDDEDGDIGIEDTGNRSFNAVNAVQSNPLLQFLAQETRLFNLHLKQACDIYERTKETPQSLFGVKAIRAVQKASGKKATAGERRKPTSFNLYIKKRIQEIKQEEPQTQDLKYTEIFRRVVQEWGELSPEQKKEFAEKHAQELQGDDQEPPKKKKIKTNAAELAR